MKRVACYSLVLTCFVWAVGSVAFGGLLIDAGDYAAMASSAYPNRAVQCAVDGSGLSDPAGHLPATHSGYPNPNQLAWHTMEDNVVHAWYIVDLGAVYDLDSMHVWNYNHPGDYTGPTATELTRGIRSYNLWVRSDDSAGNNLSTSQAAFDSTGWTLLLEEAELEPAPGLDTYLGKDVDLAGATARRVAIEVLSNYNHTDVDLDGDIDHDPFGEFAGISEVRFFAVPEPTVLTLMGLGCLLIRRRSR